METINATADVQTLSWSKQVRQSGAGRLSRNATQHSHFNVPSSAAGRPLWKEKTRLVFASFKQSRPGRVRNIEMR